MSWSSSAGWNARQGWGRQASANVTPATVVGKGDSAVLATPTQVTIPSDAGLQAGDILIVHITCNAPNALTVISQNGAGSAFSLLHSDSWTVDARSDHLYARVLSAADVADGTFQVTGTGSNDGLAMTVVRGASAAAFREFECSTLGTDSNLTFTGFTPAGGSKGTLAMVLDRDTGAASPAAAGFTSVWNHLNGFLRHFTYFNPSYGGGSINFTPFLTTFQQGGYVVEFT